ncbi:MAG: class I SAM-dependent methyltransferase [Promethearchaeota archaeon]
MPFKRTKRSFEIITAFKLVHHDPKKILDLGYGDGQITNDLHLKGYNIIGLDVYGTNHDKVKRNFPDCDFRLYNGINFPFEENTFDTVIMNDVFEHIPYIHMHKLIEEVKMILKPGGLIYISAINRYELLEPHTSIPLLTWLPRVFWNVLDVKLNKKVDWYHIWDIYPYTFRKLKKFCKTHQLEYKDLTFIYTLHKFGDLEYIGNRYLRMLVKLLKKVRLERLFYYLAYKVSVIIFLCKVD